MARIGRVEVHTSCKSRGVDARWMRHPLICGGMGELGVRKVRAVMAVLKLAGILRCAQDDTIFIFDGCWMVGKPQQVLLLALLAQDDGFLTFEGWGWSVSGGVGLPADARGGAGPAATDAAGVFHVEGAVGYCADECGGAGQEDGRGGEGA